MTVLEDRPATALASAEATSGPPAAASTSAEGRPRGRPGLRRITLVVGVVVVTFCVTVAVVIYGIGPLLHARDQRSLVASEQAAIAQASVERNGLYGVRLPNQPPTPGSAVGLLAIPALDLNQAVVEGVEPAETVSGPGHVPGTAGLGQPGNSAVVGRNAGFGGPFARLGQLKPGDKIVVATIEGQTTYVVRRVRVVKLVTSLPSSAQASAPTSLSTGASAGPPTVLAGTLYGPTPGDQLTLVTSDSAAPWNATLAQTVVAKMLGKPFVPTPQESASNSEYGITGDSGAWSPLLLALLALGLTLVGSAFLYRRTSTRVAYLLTTAPILAFTVLAALTVSRLLPAWT